MDVKVIVRGVADGTRLRELAEQKLAVALDRFTDRVLGATVRLEDETGPAKGGVDKVCHIEVRLRTGDVRIREQGEAFEATLDTALGRLKAALGRETGKFKRGVGEG